MKIIIKKKKKITRKAALLLGGIFLLSVSVFVLSQMVLAKNGNGGFQIKDSYIEVQETNYPEYIPLVKKENGKEEITGQIKIVDQYLISDLSENEFLEEYSYLKQGFQDLSISIEADEPLFSKENFHQPLSLFEKAKSLFGFATLPEYRITKMIGRSQSIQTELDLQKIKIGTHYQQSAIPEGEQVPYGAGNNQQLAIKQSITLTNNSGQDLNLSLLLKNRIEANKIYWDNQEYVITNNPRKFVNPDRISFSVGGSESFYDFSDVPEEFEPELWIEKTPLDSEDYLTGQAFLILSLTVSLLAGETKIIDPTYGVELTILNVHSHPQAGDEWTVSFATKGVADLTVTPDDQATIDDLDFVSLTCNGEERIPEILEGDVIFYPDWSCLPAVEAGEGTGEVIHLVNVARKHTLKFQFGDQIAFAYNSPGWVSPTGGSGDGWSNIPLAYDNNTSTDATNDEAPAGWGPFLELTRTAIICDKIRFWAYEYVEFENQIDIDVYYEDDWHDVYEGVFADQEWVEKDIPAGQKSIDKAQIRIYSVDYYGSFARFIYEFEFWEVPNDAPNATSVSDSPDPIAVGSDVTFTGTWTEPDAGDNVKMYICDNSSCTDCTYNSTSSCWCYSDDWVTEPTTTDSCVYTAQSSAFAENDYWLGVCDDSNACDATPFSGGIFTVATSTYNFTTGTSSDKWAYECGTATPTSPTDYEREATGAEYIAIESSDDSWWTTATATSDGEYDSQIYSIIINEATSSISDITIEWEGYGETTTDYITDLYIWNTSTPAWVNLDSIDFTTTIDQTASGTISSSIEDYIDTNSKLHVLASTKKHVAQPHTETLRPDAVGAETNIHYQYPATDAHHDKVDDVDPDAYSTYVKNDNDYDNFQRDLYDLPPPAGAGVITKVTVYALVLNDNREGPVKLAVRSNSTTTESNEKTADWGWTLVSQEWADNPADDEAWEWSDITDLQIGVALKASELMGFPLDTSCTQVYVEIDYMY